MAQKLGFLNQWLWGDWAERAAINRNAEDLSAVEADVGELRKLVQRQAEEILRLRAMFMGLAELLEEKGQVDDADLGRAVESAWNRLNPRPAEPVPSTDPYRGMPTEPSDEDIAAAKGLLAVAQDHHFSRRFQEARAIYQQIVDSHGDTKQAATARQQLENLRRA
jgi:hypothetical protein